MRLFTHGCFWSLTLADLLLCFPRRQVELVPCLLVCACACLCFFVNMRALVHVLKWICTGDDACVVVYDNIRTYGLRFWSSRMSYPYSSKQCLSFIMTFCTLCRLRTKMLSISLNRHSTVSLPCFAVRYLRSCCIRHLHPCLIEQSRNKEETKSGKKYAAIWSFTWSLRFLNYTPFQDHSLALFSERPHWWGAYLKRGTK